MPPGSARAVLPVANAFLSALGARPIGFDRPLALEARPEAAATGAEEVPFEAVDERGMVVVSVSAQDPGAAAEAVCQVCGEPLGASVVSCAACRTCHHRDCWEYVGHGSTYGCASTALGSEAPPPAGAS